MDWLDLLAVQESSPTPQFKSINSSALSFLYSPTPTSIHDHWKNHSLDQTDLCWQRSLKAFNQGSKVHPPCLQSLAAMALAGHTSQALGVFLSIYKLQVCNVTPYTHLLFLELPENVPSSFIWPELQHLTDLNCSLGRRKELPLW